MASNNTDNEQVNTIIQHLIIDGPWENIHTYMTYDENISKKSNLDYDKFDEHYDKLFSSLEDFGIDIEDLELVNIECKNNNNILFQYSVTN
jgi:hypothetical protein